MIKYSLGLFIAFICISFSVSATTIDSAITRMSDVDGHYREHNCDFTHLNINVRFVPKEGRVIGFETLEFTPIQPTIDSVYLDAPRMKIKKVLLDNSAENVAFESTKEGVIIRFTHYKLKWEEHHKLYVEYEVQPLRGLYFIGWNDDKNLSRKQIWTQGQGIDNRCWFPCFDDVDDKVITETTITFDAAYTVVSNGNLVDTKLNTDGTKTWHYAMNKPHSPYLVMIAIDKYAWKDYRSNSGIVSRQYYYSDRPEVAEPTYQYSKEMMDWLEAQTGVPYQWQVYSNSPVQDFTFGAMENTSATIYGDFYQLDQRQSLERPYLPTNAHELTHQWFGDLITEFSATHHWLHESFATYYSKMFLRQVLGEDQYQWAKRGEAMQGIGADKNDRYPIAHSHAGTSRHYPKGSFVIGMLRYVVGDAIYQKTIPYYLKKHAFENVETNDFSRAFMETSGINLDWFFDEWIYHSGTPIYNVSYEAVRNQTTFYVQQDQRTDSLIHYFRMPIVFEVHYNDGTKDTVRALVSHHYDTITVPNPMGKKIAFTLFDPGYNVMRTLKFGKSYDELVAQASHAPNMIDRYEALLALRDTAMVRKRKDLESLFAQERFYGIRAEIVSQMRINAGDEDAVPFFKKALHDNNFNVRRAAIDNLDTILPALVGDCERLLTDSSYYTLETALRRLKKQYPQNTQRYLAAVKGVKGISQNVRIAYLELKWEDKVEAERSELVDYTSVSYEFRTRVRAMEALERLDYCNAQLIKNLVDAILNPNGRLAGPATKTLKKLMQKTEVKDMANSYYKSGQWIDWQQEKLKGVFE